MSSIQLRFHASNSSIFHRRTAGIASISNRNSTYNPTYTYRILLLFYFSIFYLYFGLVYIMMMGLSISVTYHGIHLHLLQFPFYMQIVIFATKRSDGKVRLFCATLNGCVCVFFSAFLVSKKEIKRNNGIGSNPSETQIKFGAGEISYSYLWLYVLNTPQLAPPPIRSPVKYHP